MWQSFEEAGLPTKEPLLFYKLQLSRKHALGAVFLRAIKKPGCPIARPALLNFPALYLRLNAALHSIFYEGFVRHSNRSHLPHC